jgi:ABC-type transport system involved in cytochrome c biogenesis permease subunit
MDLPLQNITRFCFGASYAVALALELVMLLRPGAILRWAALAFGGAGLFAHTAFLLVQRPTVASPQGSLLLLSWVVAVFYFYGALHHRKLAWAVFVLPLALGLVLLSGAFPADADSSRGWWFTGDNFWGAVHGSLLLLASIGVCVACLASLMYLVQARRLRSKAAPGEGLRLPSLERLTDMNRRAITWAFPLLTAGLLLGLVLMAQRDLAEWTALKVFGTAGLWVAFAVLLYLRYAAHVTNRRLAVLTIAVFGLLLVTLAAAHPAVGGGRL